MSLWTPDGERPVSPAASQPTSPPAGQSPNPTPGDLAGADQPPLSPEQEEQARAMARELAEARSRLLETDVATVLTNHAMGIYELAAIHLTADEPKMEEARLAIDALTAMVTGIEGRLGENEPTLRDALQGLQVAFVQLSSAGTEAQPGPEAGS